MIKHHLAILDSGWNDLIFSGYKTIESRFTKVRCAPFGKVSAGDSVYLKDIGGLVRGMCYVKEVETFENLTASQRRDIFNRYCFKIFAGAQWISDIPQHWHDSKYATLIHIESPTAFATPFPFKQRGRQAWIVLAAPLDTTTGEVLK